MMRLKRRPFYWQVAAAPIAVLTGYLLLWDLSYVERPLRDRFDLPYVLACVALVAIAAVFSVWANRVRDRLDAGRGGPPS